MEVNNQNDNLNKSIEELTEELENSFENDIDINDYNSRQKLQTNSDLVENNSIAKTNKEVTIKGDDNNFDSYNGRSFKTEKEILENNKPSEVTASLEENGRLSTPYKNFVNNDREKILPKVPEDLFNKTTEEKANNENHIEESNENQSKMTTEDFLKGMTVDLNNIEIVDVTPMNDIKNINFFLNQKSKTQIVAIQSGYVAYVEGLNYSQINSLVNSTLDEYALQLLLAQTIYECINTTSLGKISFDEWCNITSYYDLESFEYGMYLETFPGDTEFSVKCGSCQQIIPAKVNNDSLICARNELTTQRLNEILAATNNPSTMLNSAFIHKKKRIFLNDCKAIIDIKLPTIKEHLEFLSSFNKTARDKAKHILALMIFFDNVMMIDIPKTLEKKKPCYYKVSDRQTIAEIIGKLTYNDSNALSEQINDFINQYSVNFKVRGFKCPSCQTKIRDISVEMETLLFFQMQK